MNEQIDEQIDEEIHERCMNGRTNGWKYELTEGLTEERMSDELKERRQH